MVSKPEETAMSGKSSSSTAMPGLLPLRREVHCKKPCASHSAGRSCNMLPTAHESITWYHPISKDRIAKSARLSGLNCNLVDLRAYFGTEA